MKCQRLCHRACSVHDIQQIQTMIDEKYQILWILDGIPGGVRARFSKDGNVFSRYSAGFPLGSYSYQHQKYILYNHLSFNIHYRKVGEGVAIQVFEVIPSSVDWGTVCEGEMKKWKVVRSKGFTIEWTYSVRWTLEEAHQQNRWNHYIQEVDRNYWRTIFKSVLFLLALNLVGIYALQTQVTRDFKYQLNTNLRLLNLDLERPPHLLGIFASMVGSGTQLLIAISVLLILSMCRLYNDASESGRAFIFLYSMTSYVGGFISSNMYYRYARSRWLQQSLFAHFLLPFVFFLGLLMMNICCFLFRSDFHPIFIGYEGILL
jgi:hypothetical protein